MCVCGDEPVAATSIGGSVCTVHFPGAPKISKTKGTSKKGICVFLFHIFLFPLQQEGTERKSPENATEEGGGLGFWPFFITATVERWFWWLPW